MATRDELIYALTTKVTDPDKKEHVELLLQIFLDKLELEEIQQLIDAFDGGGLDRLETVLFRASDRRGE